MATRKTSIASRASAKRPPTLKPLILAISRFQESVRRLLVVAKAGNHGFTPTSDIGIDWKPIAAARKAETIAALKAVQSANDTLKTEFSDSGVVLPDDWSNKIGAAIRLTDHAIAEAVKEKLFDGNFGCIDGLYLVNEIKFSNWMLSLVADLATVANLRESEREILQALLECSPLKGDELAERCKGAFSQDGQFREMLSDMVKAGWLASGGKGRFSQGYRLTDDGIRLATTAAQLS